MVVQRLSELSPLYLIFDLAKIGRSCPATVTDPIYLYDWLPEKQIAGFSPIVLGLKANLDLREWFELGWGFSCLIALFSSVPEEELIKRLRALTVTGNPDQPHCKYAAPEVLEEQLSRGPELFVKGLFEAVDAVLYESESADICCVQASPNFALQLKELNNVDSPQ
jgi:hypothetical protein